MTADKVQLYVMMVFGPVFVCMLAHYHLRRGHKVARQLDLEDSIAWQACHLLAHAQIQLMMSPYFHSRRNCNRCALPSSYVQELLEDPSLPKTKVCLFSTFIKDSVFTRT